MCYVVVKKRNSIGCCAYKTEHGKKLVELKNKISKGNELQVLTISKPAAYGEYAPYTFAHSEEELLALVNGLQ